MGTISYNENLRIEKEIREVVEEEYEDEDDDQDE